MQTVKKTNTIVSLLLFILITNMAYGFTAEEERWLNSDDDTDVSHINEGNLRFITTPVKENILHSVNRINISKESIDNGWVSLQQCYFNLDKINKVTISYQYRFIKNLKLTSLKNIKSGVIHKQNIELIDVKENAELCMKADVRIFYQNPDLSYSLVNGPYHRRFLDGFYPYHLSLFINYPENLLTFLKSKPQQQKGFSVTHQDNKLIIDSIFEGILNTELIFKSF